MRPADLPANVTYRGCKGKTRHQSQGKAQAHVRHLLRIGDSNVREYFCLVCKQWHVGHHGA